LNEHGAFSGSKMKLGRPHFFKGGSGKIRVFCPIIVEQRGVDLHKSKEDYSYSVQQAVKVAGSYKECETCPVKQRLEELKS